MSKRRYETIELNGKDFTLDLKETVTEESIVYNNIYDAYARPSATKLEIWLDWYRWFTDNNGTCTVASHNCNFFTIEGYVTDKETKKRYWCFITASHNRCIECVETV